MTNFITSCWVLLTAASKKWQDWQRKKKENQKVIAVNYSRVINVLYNFLKLQSDSRILGCICYFNLTTWREHYLNSKAKYFVVLATVFVTSIHICMLFLVSVTTAPLQKVRPLQNIDRLPLVAKLLVSMLLQELLPYKENQLPAERKKKTKHPIK